MGNLASGIPVGSPQCVDGAAALAARRAEVDAFIAAHVPFPDVYPHGADSDQIVFCRSVGPMQELAIILWAELAAVEHATATTTAPGLPVMVAAMLRRPVLDAYLSIAADVPRGGVMSLAARVPRSMTPLGRARLVSSPRVAAEVLTGMLDDAADAKTETKDRDIPGVPSPGFFDALAVLAAHNDLADALLAVPLHAPSRTFETNRRPFDNGGVMAMTPGPTRTLTFQRLVPMLVYHRPTATVALQQDRRAAAMLALTGFRDPPHTVFPWVSQGVDAVRLLDAMSRDPAGADAPAAWRTLAASLSPSAAGTMDQDEAVACLESVVAVVKPNSRNGSFSASSGDVNALLHQSGLYTPGRDSPERYAAFLRQIPHHTTAGFLANDNDVPDIAAALLATRRHYPPSPRAGSADVRAVARALIPFELRVAAGRHGFTANVMVPLPPLVSVRELLMPIFDHGGDGSSLVRSLGGDAAEAFGTADAHVIFGAGRTAPPAGAPATTDRSECARRWAAVSGGLLDGWPFWEHTLVVGGAVAACLDPMRPLDDVSPALQIDGSRSAPVGDIDIVFHSVTPDGVSALCAQLQEHAYQLAAARGLCGKSTRSGVAVLVTSRTMTLVFDAPELPRIQVALGYWESAASVLQSADVDACCCGLTAAAPSPPGSHVASAGVGFVPTVLATARGMLAWASKANVPSALRHAVRGSPTYELRLWKYARRHGFAVLDVLHAATDERVVQLRESVRVAAELGATEARASSRRRQARDTATCSTGLNWIVRVDEGAFTPTPTADALQVTSTVPLARVVERVTEAGYVESDNYGTHEEGYVVGTDKDGEASQPPEPASIAFDSQRYGVETADYRNDLVEVAHRAGLYGTFWRDELRENLTVNVHDALDVRKLEKLRTRWTLGEDSIDSGGDDDVDDA